MKSTLFFTFFLFVCMASASAQYAPAGEDSVSLQGQYQTLLRRSKTLQDYKLVNPYRLSGLWKNTMDSLNAERKKVKALETTNRLQNARLDSQSTNLDRQQKSLDASNERLNEMNLLGFPIDKTAYNMVMWGLVLVFALAFTIVFIRSSGYRKEARYRIGLCEEVTTEFQQYKVKASEKEKKLARELQDERNKLDELNKR